MNRSQTIVGVIGVAVMGVFIVAAIYQLGQAPTLTNNVASVANTTLNNIFK